MNDPSQALIAPFREVWLSLGAQINAWNATMSGLATTSPLHGRVHQIHEALVTVLGDRGKVPVVVGLLLEDSKVASEKVRTGLTNGLEPVVYPLLTGGWAVVEAAIEDLVARILRYDPN